MLSTHTVCALVCVFVFMRVRGYVLMCEGLCASTCVQHCVHDACVRVQACVQHYRPCMQACVQHYQPRLTSQWARICCSHRPRPAGAWSPWRCTARFCLRARKPTVAGSGARDRVWPFSCLSWSAIVLVCHCVGLPLFWSANVLVCHCFNLPLSGSAIVLVCRCPSLPLFWPAIVLAWHWVTGP